MTEPIYSTTTERLYKRLPEFYRVLDSEPSNDINTLPVEYPLKKFLSAIVDELNEVDELSERFGHAFIEERRNIIESLNEYNTYERPAGLENEELGYEPIYFTSDLFDARTANSEWLEWIGLIVGTQVDRTLPDLEQRQMVFDAYIGYRAGSNESLIRTLKAILTGTKYARVLDHHKVVSGNLTSSTSAWEVTVITKSYETPTGVDLVQYITDKGAKPAGVRLYYLPYSISWTGLETNLPNWSAIEATGSWNNLELYGLE